MVISLPDKHFYERADALIDLANRQLDQAIAGQVSASFMYALARFNAFVSSTKFDSGADMRKSRAEAVDYFVAQYREMLIENLDDYARHLDRRKESDPDRS